MAEPQALDFDDSAGMLEEEDETTLAAIEEGIAQIEAGLEIPLDDLRKEISKRCTG
jgi:predicted transcriptional regulator